MMASMTLQFMVSLALAGVLLGLAIGAHVLVWMERRSVQGRAQALLTASGEVRSFLQALGARFDESASGRQLARMLEAADLSMAPHEVLALQVFGVFVVLYVNFLFLQLPFLTVFSLSVLGVRVITNRILRRRARQRAQRFAEQLPEVADVIARGLGAGQTILQAIGEASTRLPQPAAGALRRVYQQLALGYPLGEALQQLLQVYPSPDLELMVTAILAQQRAGGNLAWVLQRLAATIAERRSMQREIRALTEEPRFSALLVIILPIAFLILFRAIMPDLIDALITHPIGWIILGISFTMQIIGFVVIRRITHIEV